MATIQAPERRLKGEPDILWRARSALRLKQWGAGFVAFLISPCPKGRNHWRGRGWRGEKREKDRVLLEVRAQAGPKVPRWERVRLHLHRVSGNRADPGNLWEMAKPVVDALTARQVPIYAAVKGKPQAVTFRGEPVTFPVGMGLIPDDSEKHVELGEATQAVDRSRRGWSALVLGVERIE